MSLLIGSSQPFGGDMGIDLGGPQRCVPEKFLNAAQIRTAIQEVGGSRVPQGVRAYWSIAWILRQERCHDLIDGSRPQRLSRRRDKNLR